MMTDRHHIEFRHVSKSYQDTPIIEDLSFTVERGSFVTLIGQSGSGKTTILKMMNGLVLPNASEVLINGINIQAEDMIMLRRNTGYAIQGSSLFPHMTIEKNIGYVPTLLNRGDKKRTHDTVRKWLAMVGLEESLLSRYPDELSGGQQQRVGIARALAANPDLLLMDEPFGAVDAITRSMLQEEIKNIHEQTGITIIFVTHDIREAMILADKVMVLKDGNIVQYATPEEIGQRKDDPYITDLLKHQVMV